MITMRLLIPVLAGLASMCTAFAQTTVTFQPDASQGQDALIGDCIPCGYYYTNFGAADDFAAMAWTNGGNISNGRSLIRFDLSSIPSGATVTSALLSLYFNPSSSNGDHQSLSGPNTALLQQITSSWDEYTVTWDNQPTTTSSGEVVLPQTTTNTEDRPDIDVTALVQQMVADPATNYGLLFRQETESYYRRMIFSSSDHVDPMRHPKLVVTYEVPGVTCLTFQPGPNQGMDAVIANCLSCGYYYTNFGSHDDFAAAAWTNGGDISDMRSLIRFDLAMIPTYATVTSAYLSLFFNPTSSNGDHQSLSGPNTALLQRVTSTWSEYGVNWDNQPSTTSIDEVVMPQTVTSDEDRPNIDVSALVQQMVIDPTNNFGFLLREETESYYRRMIFSSSDHADPARHPKLEVCYVLPTGSEHVFVPEGWDVYPNPVAGQLTLEFGEAAKRHIEIRDPSGRLLRSMQCDARTATIDASDLLSGLYIVNAVASDGSTMSTRVVVHR